MAESTEKPEEKPESEGECTCEEECTCECPCCDGGNPPDMNGSAKFIRGDGSQINTLNETIGTVFLGVVCMALLWALNRERRRYQELVERFLLK